MTLRARDASSEAAAIAAASSIEGAGAGDVEIALPFLPGASSQEWEVSILADDAPCSGYWKDDEALALCKGRSALSAPLGSLDDASERVRARDAVISAALFAAVEDEAPRAPLSIDLRGPPSAPTPLADGTPVASSLAPKAWEYFSFVQPMPLSQRLDLLLTSIMCVRRGPAEMWSAVTLSTAMCEAVGNRRSAAAATVSHPRYPRSLSSPHFPLTLSSLSFSLLQWRCGLVRHPEWPDAESNVSRSSCCVPFVEEWHFARRFVSAGFVSQPRWLYASTRSIYSHSSSSRSIYQYYSISGGASDVITIRPNDTAVRSFCSAPTGLCPITIGVFAFTQTNYSIVATSACELTRRGQQSPGPSGCERFLVALLRLWFVELLALFSPSPLMQPVLRRSFPASRLSTLFRSPTLTTITSFLRRRALRASRLE